MKNNRNTLLLISGIMYLIKSVLSCVVLVVVSVSLDVVDSSIRLKIYNSPLYNFNQHSAENLLTLSLVLMFVFIGLAIILNAACGYVCLDQSKSGTNPLSRRKTIITLSGFNIFLGFSIAAGVLSLVALLCDKNQPDAIKTEDEYSNKLKQKIDEVKKLRENGTLSKQEFLDVLTKILVQDE